MSDSDHGDFATGSPDEPFHVDPVAFENHGFLAKSRRHHHGGDHIRRSGQAQQPPRFVRLALRIEPGKRSGQPCVRGLRITVWDVLSWLAAGMTEQEILDDYPELEPDVFPRFTTSPPIILVSGHLAPGGRPLVPYRLPVPAGRETVPRFGSEVRDWPSERKNWYRYD